MTTDYGNLINQKQAELDSLKSQMEEIKKQFIRHSIAFIKEWYKTTTQNYVSTDPDHTLHLEREKLQQMKGEVSKLIENGESIANEILSDQELWGHLTGRREHDYSYYGNRPPETLDKAIRLALGKLGPILEEFGYSVISKVTKITYNPAEPVWVEWDSGGRYHSPNGRPYYPYHMDWSEGMRNTIRKYNNIFEQVKKAQAEIFTWKMQKKQEQAQNLWDSI